MFSSGRHPTFLSRACVIWVTGEEKVGAEERTKRQRLKTPKLGRWIEVSETASSPITFSPGAKFALEMGCIFRYYAK